MSVENLDTTTAIETVAAPVSDDDALSVVFDQYDRDNGSARGTNGKFAATNGDGEQAAPNAPALEGEGKGEADPDGSSTLAVQAVPLPANWTGMDADWSKIPADVQAKIAARDAELHTRMSEQGRQIGGFKAFNDIFDRNTDLLAGKTMPDGTAPTMTQAVDFLFSAQRRLDQNPIAGLIEIADRYDVRQHLAAALTGKLEIPADPHPAGITPADVERIVKDALTGDAASKAADEEVSRLAKDKPLYADIAEDDMVHAIHKARSRLGDTASNEAVFDLAYDIAIHADPDLRAKAAATKKAAEEDPKRTADARRAASVNVSSTSTGRTRELTDDELLGQAYDEAQNAR